MLRPLTFYNLPHRGLQPGLNTPEKSIDVSLGTLVSPRGKHTHKHTPKNTDIGDGQSPQRTVLYLEYGGN